MKVLVLLIAVALCGCVEDRKRAEYERSGCTYLGTTDLEERVYCGKACTRPRHRMHFSCPDKGGVYNLWYDY